MKFRRVLRVPFRLTRLAMFSVFWGGDRVVRVIKNAMGVGYDGRVLEIQTLELDDEAQLEQAMRKGRPFLMLDTDQKWKAFHQLTPEHIKTQWTDLLNVFLSGKRETFLGGRTEPMVWMTPREFVERVFEGRPTSDRMYMRGQEWRLVKDDIREQIGSYQLSHGGTVLLVGQEGTVTRLHHDRVPGLLTQIRGHKKVVLFEPSQAFNIYEDVLGPARRDQITRLPETDCMQADRVKFKRLFKAQRYEVVLKPGSVLYIPAFWWHEVTSLEPSISVGARYESVGREPAVTRWARLTRYLPLDLQTLLLRQGIVTPAQYRSSELAEGVDPPYQLDPS